MAYRSGVSRPDAQYGSSEALRRMASPRVARSDCLARTTRYPAHPERQRLRKMFERRPWGAVVGCVGRLRLGGIPRGSQERVGRGVVRMKPY